VEDYAGSETAEAEGHPEAQRAFSSSISETVDRDIVQFVLHHPSYPMIEHYYLKLLSQVGHQKSMMAIVNQIMKNGDLWYGRHKCNLSTSYCAVFGTKAPTMFLTP
jgi:hypothetical protein